VKSRMEACRVQRCGRTRGLTATSRAAAEQGDMDAICLMGEINRAETIPDRAVQLESVVTMGSWVTFWTNWGVPRETRQLVYPEDYTNVERVSRTEPNVIPLLFRAPVQENEEAFDDDPGPTAA
jgi:regulator of nucleoside diphosphate kinase